MFLPQKEVFLTYLKRENGGAWIMLDVYSHTFVYSDNIVGRYQYPLFTSEMEAKSLDHKTSKY